MSLLYICHASTCHMSCTDGSTCTGWNISSHPSHCRPTLCHTGTCHCRCSCQHRHRYHARNIWFPNRYPGYGKHCTPVHNGSSHTCRNLFECPILVGTTSFSTTTAEEGDGRCDKLELCQMWFFSCVALHLEKNAVVFM